MSTPTPGWYQDPANPLRERLWGGADWTDITRPRPPEISKPGLEQNPLPPPAPATPTPPPLREPTSEDIYTNADTGIASPEAPLARRFVLVWTLFMLGASSAVWALITAYSGPDYQIVDTATTWTALVSFSALIVFLVSCARNVRFARFEYGLVPPPFSAFLVLIALVVAYGFVYASDPTFDENSALWLPVAIGEAFMISLCVVIGLLQSGSILRMNRNALIGWGIAFVLWGSFIEISAPYAADGGGVHWMVLRGAGLLSWWLWRLMCKDPESTPQTEHPSPNSHVTQSAKTSAVEFYIALLKLVLVLVPIGIIGSFVIVVLMTIFG